MLNNKKKTDRVNRIDRIWRWNKRNYKFIMSHMK